MNIIFAGTPDFAVPCLQALLDSPHKVVAVYTQPDRPSGRGQKSLASPVKQLAQAHGIPVRQPTSLKHEREQAELASFSPDLMIVVAYGLLLPKAVLSIPRLGCLNVHASLLPRWRGASPIQQAILANDPETGISYMQMVEALDAGDVLASMPLALDQHINTPTLHDRLAHLGAAHLLEVLTAWQAGDLIPKPQDPNQVTYAKKIQKTDALLNWHLPAEQLARQIRAYAGWPVAFTYLGDSVLRIWQAEPTLEPVSVSISVSEQTAQTPGSIHIVGKTIMIRCGDGYLSLLALQLPGGKVLSAQEFLNAQRGRLTDIGRLGLDT